MRSLCFRKLPPCRQSFLNNSFRYGEDGTMEDPVTMSLSLLPPRESIEKMEEDNKKNEQFQANVIVNKTGHEQLLKTLHHMVVEEVMSYIESLVFVTGMSLNMELG
ncbi:putative transcriptional activator Myb-like [Sesbania bispinosa]|nr:putative transcriptional activator Myb-like [Sesbania bispinosa]